MNFGGTLRRGFRAAHQKPAGANTGGFPFFPGENPIALALEYHQLLSGDDADTSNVRRAHTA